MKKIKFLPHLSLIALIVFLMTDTASFISRTSSITQKNPSPAVEGNQHEEGNKGKALVKEEKDGYFSLQ